MENGALHYKLIRGSAADHGCACDMVFTDPPFDMSGAALARCLSGFEANHLLLITTMRQLLDFAPRTDWRLAFDFVIDGVMPKQSKSAQQPNYIHQTGVYMTRGGARSVFNRKRRQRADVFEGNGYWPTIFHAPRTSAQQHGQAKNPEAMTDLLGSFDVRSVCDPFAGTGTIPLACAELGLSCTAVELDAGRFAAMKKSLCFVGRQVEVVE